MPFEEGYELMKYALDAEIEDKLFTRWINGYQQMMGFEEFKSKVSSGVKNQNDTRTEDEIFDYVLGILR